MTPPYEIKESAGCIYLKPLRELTRDDFEPVVHGENSVKFMCDKSWEVNIKPTIGCKDPRYQATITLKFRWARYFLLELNKFHDKKIENLGCIEDMMKSSSIDMSAYVHHQFNWKGCRGEPSRYLRIDRERAVFDKLFEETSPEKEEALYLKIIDKINRAAYTVNYKWNQTVSQRIANNLGAYTEKTMQEDAEYLAIEERVTTLQKMISEMEERIKPMREEINELRHEQKGMKLGVVKGWFRSEGLHESLEKSIIESFDKEQEKKDSTRFPHF